MVQLMTKVCIEVIAALSVHFAWRFYLLHDYVEYNALFSKQFGIKGMQS